MPDFPDLRGVRAGLYFRAVDDTLKDFIAIALDKYVLLVAGGIFAGIRAAARYAISAHPLYRRFLPLLPEAMGVGAVLSGGVPTADTYPVALKIALGLWCGYLAQKFQKLVGQTILGDDRFIEASAAAKLVEPPPADPSEGGPPS